MKFSNRSSGIQTESLNTAILTIKNFQVDDLGIYICRAKAISPLRYEFIVKGEAHFYFMASEFGFDESEQLLLNPDINIKSYCNQEGNECKNPLRAGDSALLSCGIENFGKILTILKYF